MKMEVLREDFLKEFLAIRPKNFSVAGLNALYDYIIEYEESTGETINLDIIAICCDYVEYKSFKELQQNYKNIKSIKDLKNKTETIEIKGTKGLIIKEF